MPEPFSAADPASPAETPAALKAKYPPAEGPAADIDPRTWDAWNEARRMRDVWDAAAAEWEIAIRNQAGPAKRLKVAGRIVAIRIIHKAENESFTKDYYRRTGAGS